MTETTLRPVGTIFETTYDQDGKQYVERMKVIAHTDNGTGGKVEMLQVMERFERPKGTPGPSVLK